MIRTRQTRIDNGRDGGIIAVPPWLMRVVCVVLLIGLVAASPRSHRPPPSVLADGATPVAAPALDAGGGTTGDGATSTTTELPPDDAADAPPTTETSDVASPDQTDERTPETEDDRPPSNESGHGDGETADDPPAGQEAPSVDASPAVDQGNVITATDITTANSVLSLTIVAGADASFGSVAPTGELTGTAGISSMVDDTGAFYVKERAATIKVTSNDPTGWSVTCSAGENTGSAPGISVADGRLSWRNAAAAEDGWTSFTTDPSAGQVCATGNGTTEVTFDYRLRVNWSDAPGSFASTVTYEVSS